MKAAVSAAARRCACLFVFCCCFVDLCPPADVICYGNAQVSFMNGAVQLVVVGRFTIYREDVAFVCVEAYPISAKPTT